jgi:hypothetical protein
LAGCGSTIDDISSERTQSNIAVKDENGKVTGIALVNQRTVMVASNNADAKDSYISIPSGALSANTEIVMGDAQDKSIDLLGAIEVTATVVEKGAPLYVAPTGGHKAISGSLSLSLPLPSTDGFDLATASGKLVFIYLIYTSDGWRAGIKTLTTSNLIGTYVSGEFKGLGYFQIAYMSAEIEDQEKNYTGADPILED